MMKHLTTCLLLAVAAPAFAADRAADEKAIASRTKEFAESLAAGDAKQVADFWTTEGEYAHDGKLVHGREALEKAYAAFFESKPGLKVQVDSLAVRFLSQDTAIAEGKFHTSRKDGESGPSGFAILYVREEGQWLMALLRETQHVPTLSDLDWLVGSWEMEAEGVKIRTTYRKVFDGAFLQMEFSAETEEGTTRGLQMIGMDSALGTPRSWLFSSDGGYGAGLWHHDGKAWRVEASGRTADGGEMTAVNIMTPIDENSFTWKSTERVIGGEPRDDSPELTVIRVKQSQ